MSGRAGARGKEKRMGRKSAAGTGTIRKKTVTRSGKRYTYWEARFTSGFDPGTGKQVQRSITGKTQKEVTQKLKEATMAVDQGVYIQPVKLTVGEWMDTWAGAYLEGVKPLTKANYEGQIKNHIKPGIGSIRLERLTPEMVQTFINGLSKGEHPLSPASVKITYSVLNLALKQAKINKKIPYNPAADCKLPRAARREIKPLDSVEIDEFLKAIKGNKFEVLYTLDLFTGLRRSELLGLMWNDVDFKAGTITVERQIQREKKKGGTYFFTTLKNDRKRTISPAPWVMRILKSHKARQAEQRLKAGAAWEDSGLVFTNEFGHHLYGETVYKNFKRIIATIGLPETRLHDLRHSYAVASIRAGDDIKTIQDNLGHATAVFTLDVYAHATEQMKKESATRMEAYIEKVLGLK